MITYQILLRLAVSAIYTLDHSAINFKHRKSFILKNFKENYLILYKFLSDALFWGKYQE